MNAVTATRKGLRTTFAALAHAAGISFSAWTKPIELSTYREIFRKEDGDDRVLFSYQNDGTILSLGLNIVVGFAGLLDLGFVAFFAIASGAPDPVVEALSPNTPSTVRNFITLMPCGTDLENLVSQTVSLSVAVFNEFEQRISLGGPSVECWARLPLEAIGGGSLGGCGAGRAGYHCRARLL